MPDRRHGLVVRVSKKGISVLSVGEFQHDQPLWLPVSFPDLHLPAPNPVTAAVLLDEGRYLAYIILVSFGVVYGKYVAIVILVNQ